MKQTKYILPALAIPFLLAACSEDTVINSQPEEFLPIRVQVSVPEATTRTVLTETGGNLAWQWSENDQLAVTNANGVNKGSLKLISFDNDAHTHATFEGYISSTLPNGENTLNILYTSDDPTSISGSYQCDYSEQDGAITSLKSRDVLVSSVVAKKTDDYVLIPSFSMIHCFSAGHFSLSFDGETPEISKVEVSGVNVMNSAEIDLKDGSWKSSEGTITITPGASDFYMTLIPANGVDMKFKAYGKDGKEYEGTLGVTFDLDNAVYVRKDLGNGSYSGIPVKMNPVQPEEPAVDDTVGPVFEYNGRKFKFTRGNLYYNTVTKEWSLAPTQYSYVRKRGWTDGSGADLVTPQAEIIDFFGWGATGLYDREAGNSAQDPTFWVESATSSSVISSNSYSGSSYPCKNHDYNNCGNGGKLANGLQSRPNFDWGTAYAQAIDSSDYYFTLTSEEWKQVSDQSIMCLGTIEDLYTPDTQNLAASKRVLVTGLFIIPGTLDEAKQLLTSAPDVFIGTGFRDMDLRNSSDYSKIDVNAIKMPLESLEKILDKIVFLPMAGNGSQSKGSVSTDYPGCYWTSEGSSTTNGYYFRFFNKAYNNAFKIESVTRSMACSVRLVKEIK